MIERAYYQSEISAFLSASSSEILGELSQKNLFPLEIPQRNAWVAQIANLKEQLAEIQEGDIFLEFSIPRMGKRVAILLTCGVIWVVEYKVGAKTHDPVRLIKQWTTPLTSRISMRVAVANT
jgi:hypothetical protein